MLVAEWHLVVVDEIGLVDQSKSLTLRYHANLDPHFDVVVDIVIAVDQLHCIDLSLF